MTGDHADHLTVSQSRSQIVSRHCIRSTPHEQGPPPDNLLSVAVGAPGCNRTLRVVAHGTSCGQNEAMNPSAITQRALAILPEDIAAIAWVGDVDVTAEGSHVAYTVTRLSLERDEAISAIWVASVGSPSGARQFTTGARRDVSPKWSPDGQMLAFLSERPSPDVSGPGADRPQVYVMPSAGGEARRLTSLSGGVLQFAWAPDSARIACVASVSPETYQDAKPKVFGDRAPSKPFRVINTLKYRRNGEGFIDSRRHLFVVSVDDPSDAIQVTAGDFDHSDPSWSPDGTELVFVSARHDYRDQDNAQSVMAINMTSADELSKDIYQVRIVVDPVGPASFPSWSPDGKWIAYAGHTYPRDTGRHTRIWVAPSHGGQPQPVADLADRNVAASSATRPTWSNDSSALVFTVEDDGMTSLVRAMRPDLGSLTGPHPLRVVAGGHREVSAFASATNSDTTAYVVSDPGSFPEVRVLRGTQEATNDYQLSLCNSSFVQSCAVGTYSRFTLSQSDGPLTVWIYLPPDVDETVARSVPVLVNIHGGPHAQYGDRFFDEFAVYVGAGYAVVFTNPHGSTGRSEHFTRSIRGDWGGIDAHDVLAAVDFALAVAPCLDPNRMGVIGGSYGGYLTSWIVAHDHRFKAACSERAVNDLASFAGTSDIGFWFAEGQLGMSPFDNPDLAARHSPLHYASAVRTPLLIMHAEHDFRCPIEQAERLFVALATRKHSVRFVRVPDADHELSRSGRPRQRVERFRHILEWFEPFLRPRSGRTRDHD
jgi:dipeptidyl aminopeptidase/acylaminoacyl peptidase